MNTLVPFSTGPLLISIAIPIVAGERTFRLKPDAPRFAVTLVNVSDRPQKIWTEDCSAGNSNLILEIMSMDGETLFQPIIVERRAQIWRRNCIRGETLEPGDTVVREIHLYKYGPGERPAGLPLMFSDHVAYIGFPSLGETTTRHNLRMRAIFEIMPNKWTEAQSIWTGRAVSETHDYTVWGSYL